MLYTPALSQQQRELLRHLLEPLNRKFRKHDPIDILEGIHYVIYTGCQWKKLPLGFPPWQTVYYHFRSWCEKCNLDQVLRMLVMMKRTMNGQTAEPTITIIDSTSVRIGHPNSESGVDGAKKIKGIKRHIAVDENGYIIGVHITTANVHDSKGAALLISNLLSEYLRIATIKGDLGYRGAFKDYPMDEFGIEVDLVKSNYGTSKFVPIQGRWRVEGTFSWLQTFRRLMRNYEIPLSRVRAVTMLAAVFMMIKYF